MLVPPKLERSVDTFMGFEGYAFARPVIVFCRYYVQAALPQTVSSLTVATKLGSFISRTACRVSSG